MKTLRNHKLSSKRVFVQRLEELKQDHHWLIQGKDLEMRPGWLYLLNQTFEKIKCILSAKEIEENNLGFLYCATHFRLHVFVDASQLPEAKSKAIEFLLERLRHESEKVCPKCGINIEGNWGQGQLCSVHPEFNGDFAEDYRRHKAANKVKAVEDLETEDNEDLPESKPPVVDQVESPPEEDQLRLYCLEDVQKIVKSLRTRIADADQRNRIKGICDDMMARGEYRPYCKLPAVEVFDALAECYPNFAESIAVISNAVALAKIGNGVLEIPPMLLVGPPGIGKTQVANEIAKLLETDFCEIRMENEQSGAGISGSSEFWSNTQTGVIFNTLTKGKTANPIILLDELDKVSIDARFNPASGLYSLLERETATRFEDQSIRGLPIDASGIIWLVTANDESLIPAPILSRVMVHRVRPPTKEESIVIARSIYASLRQVKAWGQYFAAELHDEVAERLADLEPRKMKVSILAAFGRAAMAGRREIRKNDLPTKVTSLSMGFVAGVQG
jgi:ATP-dependent Lon protease